MSTDAPLSSVSFSLDDVHFGHDDQSELTGPYGIEAEDDDFLVKLAADPYYYSTLRGSHNSRTKKQEEIDLTAQLVRQNEKVERLSSKLSNCEVENEALKAENAALVHRLDRDHDATQEKSIPKQGWFSKGLNHANGGSMQLLVDANAKLMTDNARLQTLADVMKKSLKSYIKESRKVKKKDKQVMKKLQEENTLLHQLLGSFERSKLSSSVHTSKTCEMHSFTEKKQEDCIINISQSWTPKVKSRKHSSAVEISSDRPVSVKTQEEEDPLANGSHHPAPRLRKSLGSIQEQELEILVGDDGCIKERKGTNAPPLNLFGELPNVISFPQELLEKTVALEEGDGAENVSRRKSSADLLADLEFLERAAAPRKGGIDAEDRPLRKSSDEILVDFREPIGAQKSGSAERSFPIGTSIRVPMDPPAAPRRRGGDKNTPRRKSSDEMLVDFREPIRAQKSQFQEQKHPSGTGVGAPATPSGKEASVANGVARSSSCADLQDVVKKSATRKPRRTSGTLSQSLNEGRRKPEELLVDFNTAQRTRRNTSRARRWSSVKF